MNLQNVAFGNKRCYKIEELFVETLCVVCMDNNSVVTIIPCKHKCVCNNCFLHLLHLGGRCPVCRVVFTTSLHDVSSDGNNNNSNNNDNNNRSYNNSESNNNNIDNNNNNNSSSKSRQSYIANPEHSANILGTGPMVNRISSYNKSSFVVNDSRIHGPVALLPGLRLQWKVDSFQDLKKDMFTPYLKVHPPLDILVIGTGARIEMMDAGITEYLRQTGLMLEVQDTRHACATYNFLSEEGRLVGAALFPPQ
eukprot:m.331872 g.331872  ORF g.331872 m.331872 type:complete len:251 (-) comp16806_c0_seq1:144-896(-)